MAASLIKSAQQQARARYREKHKARLAEANRRRYLSKRDIIRAQHKTWREQNPEYARKWREKNIDRLREYDLKRCSGATMAQRSFLLTRQENCCAGCGVDFSLLRSKAIHVDHCHRTGAIRGILCTRCNSTLGFVRDSVETLQSLQAYLMRTPPELSDVC